MDGRICCLLHLFFFCLCLQTSSTEEACLKFYVPIQVVEAGDRPTKVEFQVRSNCTESLASTSFRIKKHFLYGSICKKVDLSSRYRENDDCGCEETDKGKLWSCFFKFRFPRQRRYNLSFFSGSTVFRDQIVGFTVRYPTLVRSFNFTSMNSPLVLDPGQPFQLTCQWIEGNPMRTIQILDSQNRTVMSSQPSPKGRNNSVTVKVKEEVECEDMGTLRCLEEGTPHSQSATLLVRCPLRFVSNASAEKQTVKPGEDATFSFDVVSYTTEVTSCWLRIQGYILPCNINMIPVTVVGQLPYLTVTMTLKSVDTQHDGEWTMSLSNPVGSGRTTFHLSVLSPTGTENIIDTLKDAGRLHLGLALGAILVSTVSVTIVTIVMILMWKKNRRPLHPAETSEAADTNIEPVDSLYFEPVSPPGQQAGTYEGLKMEAVGMKSLYSGIGQCGNIRKERVTSPGHTDNDDELYEIAA